MSDPQADEAFRKSVCTQPPGSGRVRAETDSLGDQEVPVDAYWGVNVSRALENFAISGRPISVYSDLIYALRVRQAGGGARQRRSRRAGALEGGADRARPAPRFATARCAISSSSTSCRAARARRPT